MDREIYFVSGAQEKKSQFHSDYHLNLQIQQEYFEDSLLVRDPGAQA